MRIQQQIWTVTGWDKAVTCEWGDQVQLVLAFGSPMRLKQSQWQKDLRQCYPNAYVLGCSTAGEIADIRVLDDALVATAIAFEHAQVKAASIELQAAESSFEAGQRLGQAIDPTGLAHVFLLSDGLQVNGSDLVRGLTAQLPEAVTLTGGLSGDGDRFSETLVMLNDAPQSGMIGAVGLYGERLTVGYGSLGGWTPFGPERRITKSVGNVLVPVQGF